jgi:dTDP-4-amino-4,6-dideoxygalactose transaminase
MAAQVGIEQFKLIDKRADKRHRLGTMLDAKLRAIPGVTPRLVPKGHHATYWHYAFRINPDILGCTNSEFAAALTAEGIECNPSRATGVMEWSLFRNDADDRYACSYHCPLYKGPRPDYNAAHYPGMQQVGREMVTIALASTFSVRDTLDIARGVAKVAAYYLGCEHS